MLEIIQQNPIISLVACVVPAIAATWKVMEILFIKPRDFRISILEKNVDEIRKEMQRPTYNAKKASPLIDQHQKNQTNNAITEKCKKNIFDLGEMEGFYKTWWDRSLTELQRDQFEKYWLGKEVTWTAKISSVSEERDGILWVSLTSATEDSFNVHIISTFPSAYKEALLLIDKNAIIKVYGIIDSFSLAPIIKDCKIVNT